jgi:hypothetical protein
MGTGIPDSRFIVMENEKEICFWGFPWNFLFRRAMGELKSDGESRVAILDVTYDARA